MALEQDHHFTLNENTFTAHAICKPCGVFCCFCFCFFFFPVSPKKGKKKRRLNVYSFHHPPSLLTLHKSSGISSFISFYFFHLHFHIVNQTVLEFIGHGKKGIVMLAMMTWASSSCSVILSEFRATSRPLSATNGSQGLISLIELIFPFCNNI